MNKNLIAHLFLIVVPPLHAVQTDHPPADQNLPAGQISQLVDPAFEYCPGEHDVQLDDWDTDEYFPAGQIVQLPEPWDGA